MSSPATATLVLVSLLAVAVRAAEPAAAGAPARTHLFVLSGQSNMVGLDPDASFTPAVSKALAGDRVLVVKDASSGKSIANWYRPPSPKEPAAARGALYVRLLEKVRAATSNAAPDTVTLVWMQGEADTHRKVTLDYGACLTGLVTFVRQDLGRPDAGVVIGRISDYGNADTNRPGWMKVRATQVAFAEADPRAAWIDTDDLNGDQNGLHYPRQGYAEMGRRFAAKALALIANVTPRPPVPPPARETPGGAH